MKDNYIDKFERHFTNHPYIFINFFAIISIALYKINEVNSNVYNSAWWSIFYNKRLSYDAAITGIIWYKFFILIFISFILSFILYKAVCKLFSIKPEDVIFPFLYIKK